MMGWNRVRRAASRLALTALLVVGAVAGVAPARALATAPAGPVTFAVPFSQTWVFPIWNVGEGVANWDVLQSWLPLYWYGDGGRAQINQTLSVADLPVYSNGGRTLTITLKPYTWSNGSPVTTRDIRFWMNLLIESDKKYPANWVGYSATGFPFNISSIRYESPRTFAITFNRPYNRGWLLYNELSQIYTIPQYAWDKTSSHGPIGNYDMSPSGALAVLNFLNQASKALSTWATNPLWQAVDGPFRMSSYVPATGVQGFVQNRHYTGAAKPTIKSYELVPYTSDTSEFAALLTGHVDYGWLPLTDLNLRGELQRRGFTVSPWYLFGFAQLPVNYTNPTVGPMFRQLYIRQALQHLINQAQFVREIFHGYAVPTYGPVPTAVPNPFADRTEMRNPYPYSVHAAVSLLADHGWRVESGGTTTCERPGTGAGECGAGIAKGAQLSLTMLYAAGRTTAAQESAAMQSDFGQVGIHLSLREEPIDSLFAAESPCNRKTGSGCSWEMINTGQGWVYSAPQFYPSGESLFETGAGSNGFGYSNATADRLIVAVERANGPGALRAYENFMTDNLPTLGLPWQVDQVSAINPALHGALPQDPYQQIYPQYWRVSA